MNHDDSLAELSNDWLMIYLADASYNDTNF